MKHSFFAVDIGASSGRTMLGTLENGVLQLSELTRFANPLIEVNGHFHWNILALYTSILEGLKKAASAGVDVLSIGIDTWGVDFAAIDQNNQVLGNPYSYRDPHTVNAPEEFFQIIPREKVYAATGIQIMNFNSLFQFFTLNKNNCTAFKNAQRLLFMPDALAFLLSGEAVTEYTIASTGQVLDPFKKCFDKELLAAAGLTEDKFGRMVMPGTVIGSITESVQTQVGLPAIPVVAVAGHDTASAVAAVPASDENFAYLSSGTWSLMGCELKEPIVSDISYQQNFTNEGGVEGTIRYLKNICGMWLLERCRKEWEGDTDYQELIAGANTCEPFKYLINPDDGVFANPVNMSQAIADYCDRSGQGRPSSKGEFVRCIFESLALRYKQVFIALQDMVPFKLEKLHVIGGGSRNQLLNQFTANALGIPVITGPSEATAIGNIMMQAKALGIVKDLEEIRKIVARSEKTEQINPQTDVNWNEAFDKFIKISSI